MSGRQYPARPIVGIGVVLLRWTAQGCEVLLVQRGKPPGQGAWSLPGGAQRIGETAEQAARRELAEETGLSAGPLSLVAHVDSIHPDAEGRIEYHYTILDFAGIADPDGPAEPVAGDDALLCRFVRAEGLAGYALTAEALMVIDGACGILG